MRERVAAYATVGVQHLMVAPEDREVDDLDSVIEAAGKLVRWIFGDRYHPCQSAISEDKCRYSWWSS